MIGMMLIQLVMTKLTKAFMQVQTIDGCDFGATSSFPDEFHPICGSANDIIGSGKWDDDVLGHLIEDWHNTFIIS